MSASLRQEPRVERLLEREGRFAWEGLWGQTAVSSRLLATIGIAFRKNLTRIGNQAQAFAQQLTQSTAIYTSREGGAALRKAALASLKKFLETEASKPQARLFSLRHEFPSEWHRLQRVADNNGDHRQTFSLNKQRFPFMFQSNEKQITVNRVELFGIPKGSDVPALKLTLTDPEGQGVNLQTATAIGLLVHSSADTDLEVKSLGDDGNEADWAIQVKKADVPVSLGRLEDILVLCHYSVRDV